MGGGSDTKRIESFSATNTPFGTNACKCRIN